MSLSRPGKHAQGATIKNLVAEKDGKTNWINSVEIYDQPRHLNQFGGYLA